MENAVRRLHEAEQGKRVAFFSVAVKGASASGEWLKIAPPPGCILWVGRKYVEPVPPRVGGERDRPPTALTESKPPKVVTPPSPVSRAGEGPASAAERGRNKADLPAGLRAAVLADREGQGRKAQYEGVLGPAGLVWHKPSNYRLIKVDSKGHIVSACYVLGDDASLSRLKGKTLLISGREYWIRGVGYPVVTADQVVMSAED